VWQRFGNAITFAEWHKIFHSVLRRQKYFLGIKTRITQRVVEIGTEQTVPDQLEYRDPKCSLAKIKEDGDDGYSDVHAGPGFHALCGASDLTIPAYCKYVLRCGPTVRTWWRSLLLRQQDTGYTYECCSKSTAECHPHVSSSPIGKIWRCFLLEMARYIRVETRVGQSSQLRLELVHLARCRSSFIAPPDAEPRECWSESAYLDSSMDPNHPAAVQ
jgi:hypothetical protein